MMITLSQTIIKLCFLLLATLPTSLSSSFKGSDEQDLSRFQIFIRDFNRTYSSSEEKQRRFRVFQETLKLIDQRNLQNVATGGDDNVHGVTIFADLTQEEFQNTYLMKQGYYTPPDRHPAPAPHLSENRRRATLSSNVDWRKQNAVTPVKQQGQCGACWAFSVTQAMESFGVIYGLHQLEALSVQQVCACTYTYNGCNGGNPQNAYDTAIKALGGLETNAYYPFTYHCANCQVRKGDPKALSTKGYTRGAYGDLQYIVNNVGPPVTTVAAQTWNTYTGGVITHCPGFPDHAVQVVGYTTSGVSTPYWIVRNTWGPTWGEQGYIHVMMAGDTCRIQEDITYPNVVEAK